jgi:hypothetical protein
VAGFCEHGDEHSSSIKKAGYCSTSYVTIGFSKIFVHHGVSKCGNNSKYSQKS